MTSQSAPQNEMDSNRWFDWQFEGPALVCTERITVTAATSFSYSEVVRYSHHSYSHGAFLPDNAWFREHVIVPAFANIRYSSLPSVLFGSRGPTVQREQVNEGDCILWADYVMKTLRNLEEQQPQLLQLQCYIVPSTLPDMYSEPGVPSISHVAVVVCVPTGYVLLDPAFLFKDAVFLTEENGFSYYHDWEETDEFYIQRKGKGWLLRLTDCRSKIDVWTVYDDGRADAFALTYFLRSVSKEECDLITEEVSKRRQRISYVHLNADGKRLAHLSVRLDKSCVEAMVGVDNWIEPPFHWDECGPSSSAAVDGLGPWLEETGVLKALKVSDERALKTSIAAILRAHIARKRHVHSDTIADRYETVGEHDIVLQQVGGARAKSLNVDKKNRQKAYLLEWEKFIASCPQAGAVTLAVPPLPIMLSSGNLSSDDTGTSTDDTGTSIDDTGSSGGSRDASELSHAAKTSSSSSFSSSSSSSSASSSGGGASRWGFYVQAPWGRMLLGGTKSVETRTYLFPPSLFGQRVYLMQEGEEAGTGTGTEASMVVIGTFVVSDCISYDSLEQWQADYFRHRVPPDSKFKWGAEQAVGAQGSTGYYGWVVSEREMFETPVFLPMERRTQIFRSWYMCYGL